MTTTQTTTPPETPKPQPRTWKPTVAGILMILAGVVAIVAGIIHAAAGDLGVFTGMPWIGSSANPNWALFVTGAIAIVGGIFALLRKMWWLAVVGVIFSMFFTIWPVLTAGVISIILLVFSQKEFKPVKK